MIMPHRCHAEGCTTRVPANLLMCKPHWLKVPAAIRDEVWATYRRGQEVDKRPSDAYIVAHHKAINAVAAAEGRPMPYPHFDEALKWTMDNHGETLRKLSD